MNFKNVVADFLSGMHESYVNGFDNMQNIPQHIGAIVGEILYRFADGVDIVVNTIIHVIHFIF